MAAYKNSNSHRHRKFNRYTGDVSKKRSRASFRLWWIIPLSALAAFVLALILGNCLGSRVDEPKESSPPETEESSPVLPPAVSVSIDSIDGIFVGLEGIYDNTYDEVSKQIPDGTEALSLSMFLSNGAPLYKSEVAIACGKPSGELTLKNIFRYPNENGIYVSVPFPSEALSGGEAPAADVLAAYEFSMIKELYEAGADEVIIMCNTEELEDNEFISRAAEYIADLKRKVEGIHVGFMIASEDGNATEAIDTICDYADFIAIDMTDADDAEKLTASVDLSLVNILRYKMRVLISGGDGEALSAKYGALDAFGIKNRQVVTK